MALHWARLLHQAGHRVILADSLRLPIARATRFKARYVRLPAPRDDLRTYAKAIETLVREEKCDLVIPTCEEVFYLAAARDLLGANFVLFAPPFTMLAQTHNKFLFSKMAANFDMAPKETILLNDIGDLATFKRLSVNYVFKPIWSRFGERVLVCPSSDELATVRPTPADQWVAQSYLPGEELCCWAMAYQGKLVALQAYRPLYRAGQGASLAFEHACHQTIDKFVGAFVQKSNWHGQISFDFKHDENNQLKVIECNPRGTSGIHFFSPHDQLPRSILGQVTSKASGRGKMTLPLAMLAYGLPFAFGHQGVAQWFKDFRLMTDIAVWPADRNMLLPQIASLAEIAVNAVRRRKGLRATATDDIEWNGEDLLRR